MSRSFGRSLWASTVAIVLVVGACTPGASPGASGSPAASASESAAASGPDESTVTGASCQEGATEVKFWTEHTPPASDTLASIVDAFNQANPTICVKMTIVPGASIGRGVNLAPSPSQGEGRGEGKSILQQHYQTP